MTTDEIDVRSQPGEPVFEIRQIERGPGDPLVQVVVTTNDTVFVFSVRPDIARWLGDNLTRIANLAASNLVIATAMPPKT